jgi:hypothetical protein
MKLPDEKDLVFPITLNKKPVLSYTQKREGT